MGARIIVPISDSNPYRLGRGNYPPPSLVALARKPENPLEHCAQAGFPVEGKEKELEER